jgi:aminopeptidase 2
LLTLLCGKPASQYPSLSLDTTASLHLHYAGPLRSDITGFFVSPYKHADGTEDSILTTFTAPTNARRAFPCFDEPALKATFTMSLVTDPGLTCLGNMPIEETASITDADDTVKTLTRFETTPPMSTYLLTWAVGNLSYTENTSARIPVRIYVSPADNPDVTHYAADIIARGITSYEALFGVEYPLPKLDLLAPPVFMQGGMEDWGLIVAHPAFFSFDEGKDGEQKRETMARLLLHELAHQWFGDLVTLQWWDQTWLNEGG